MARTRPKKRGLDLRLFYRVFSGAFPFEGATQMEVYEGARRFTPEEAIESYIEAAKKAGYAGGAVRLLYLTESSGVPGGHFRKCADWQQRLEETLVTNGFRIDAAPRTSVIVAST